jgi:hypothetical protein
MHKQRIYSIRQGILATARDLDPAPIGMDDLDASLDLRRLRPDRTELVTELNYLTRSGFLAAIPESDNEYARITATGLDQINVETSRDPRIWGRAAL